ncbi:hypothetical protein ACOMHN_063009 [Nucella lapillus]
MPPTRCAADPLCRRPVMPPTRCAADPLCCYPALFPFWGLFFGERIVVPPTRYAADPLCRKIPPRKGLTLSHL